MVAPRLAHQLMSTLMRLRHISPCYRHFFDTVSAGDTTNLYIEVKDNYGNGVPQQEVTPQSITK